MPAVPNRPVRSSILGGDLRVSRGLTISLSEIEWRFSTTGGPGGQHANRSSTRVEARFNIARSPSLGPWQRSRLLEQFGESITVVASEERSQVRNRQIALERLSERLAGGLKTKTPRRATKPTAASRQRRLDEKHRRSKRKRDRASGSVTNDE